MITNEDLATAEIAKIFGSELLKAQESSRTDSGQSPQFLKIHPSQFLRQQTSNQQTISDAQQKRIIEQLQREAEAAYPLSEKDTIAPQQHFPPSFPPPAPPEQQPSTNNSSLIGSFHSANTNEQPALERIAVSLEQIANSLAQVNITVKRKTKKRIKTSNESFSK